MMYYANLKEEKDEVDTEGKDECSIFEVVEVACQEAYSPLVVAANVNLIMGKVKCYILYSIIPYGTVQ